MREILFRGKTIDGDWTYGYYVFTPKRTGAFGQITSSVDLDRHHILTMKFNIVKEVIPETIGQYTGLTDKNGKKIFEGDILEFSDRIVTVFWHAHLGCWDTHFLKFTNKKNSRADMSPLNWQYKSEIIGNIHDNPELLKGGVH